MEDKELLRHLTEALLQLILMVAIVVLFGMGVNYYVGFGIACIILYVNLARSN